MQPCKRCQGSGSRPRVACHSWANLFRGQVAMRRLSKAVAPPPYVWAHILRRDRWGLFRFVAWLGPRGWVVARPDTPEPPKTQPGPR